jgi:hypothetical protein
VQSVQYIKYNDIIVVRVIRVKLVGCYDPPKYLDAGFSLRMIHKHKQDTAKEYTNEQYDLKSASYPSNCGTSDGIGDRKPSTAVYFKIMVVRKGWL